MVRLCSISPALMLQDFSMYVLCQRRKLVDIVRTQAAISLLVICRMGISFLSKCTGQSRRETGCKKMLPDSRPRAGQTT